MDNEKEKVILNSDLYLIKKALEKLKWARPVTLPKDIELLNGGCSGARVYRVPIHPIGNVIARITACSAAKAEVVCYSKYVEPFVLQIIGFPTMFHPVNDKGKADPEYLETGLVDGEKMGVIILSDQRWTSTADSDEPVGSVFSRTLLTNEVTPGVLKALTVMEKLREYNSVNPNVQPFYKVFEFYNSKLPAGLTVVWKDATLNSSQIHQPMNYLCADYADRKNAQPLLKESTLFGFSPLQYKWSRRGVPDAHVCVDSSPLYYIDVTGLPEKPIKTHPDLHFTGSITGTRYKYLTNRWQEVLKKSRNDTFGSHSARKSDESAEVSGTVAAKVSTRKFTLPTDLLVAITHWASDLWRVHLEFDPPFWPSEEQAAPQFRQGVIHGDLHAGNILCLRGATGAPPSYSIIDLELMSNDAPVAHDAARLEVDLLLRALEPLYEDGSLNLDELVCLGDYHFAQAIKGYDASEPPYQTQYGQASQVMLAVRRVVIGNCSTPTERLTRLLEHLWCVFFNALQFFCYDGLSDSRRALAWFIASYFGSQAQNPAAWLAASENSLPFNTVLSTLAKDSTENSARAVLLWLNAASQPTELERPLWRRDQAVDAAKQQVFQHLLTDFWFVIQNGFLDIAARFVKLGVRSGPGRWTYEITLTAKPSSDTDRERDVDEVIDDKMACVLLGPPGCGKSTIGIHILSRAFSEPKYRLILPLLADLPTVAAKEEVSFKALSAKSGSLIGSPEYQALERELEAILPSPTQTQLHSRGIQRETMELASSFLPLKDNLSKLFADTQDIHQRMAHLAYRLRSVEAQNIPITIANQLAARTRSFIFSAATESLEAALHHCGPDAQPDSGEALDRYLSHVKKRLPALLDQLWNTGSLYLVLDSLNEVAAEKRADLTTSLRNLVARRWGNRIIILSRQHNYKADSLGIPEYSIMELDRERFLRFVQKWMDRKKTPGNHTEMAVELWDTFNGPNAPESAKVFSRSPLSLWMLLTVCYGDTAGDAPLPPKFNNRSSVFREFVERSIRDLPSCQCSLELLERLGFLMVESGNVTQLATEETKKNLAPEFNNFDELMMGLERVGLVQMREDIFRFNHQSIQEYCAAQHLWRLGDTTPDSFREKIRLERWDESVHLLILFDKTDTKDTRRQIFELMLEERTFDLLADCFSHAESVQWEQVEGTLGAIVKNPLLALPFRREALLALGRINNRELNRESIATWVLRLLHNEHFPEVLWPDALMVHVGLGDELYMLLEQKTYLQQLLHADFSNPSVRTKTLEYLCAGKFGIHAAKIVDEPLMRLLTDNRTIDSDAALVAQTLQMGEVRPNLSTPDIENALILPLKSTVHAVLKWLGDQAPISISVLNGWVKRGWLDLFMEHKVKCHDLSGLWVNENLLKDLSSWRLKERTHSRPGDQEELVRCLSYLECLGSRGDPWLPAVVELALLSAPSYQKLARDFLIAIPNQPNADASPLRARLTERTIPRNHDFLIHEALEENPSDVFITNASAFLLGQSYADLDAEGQKSMRMALQTFGNSLVENGCANVATWIRLLYLVSQLNISEMVDDLNRWGWALFEKKSVSFMHQIEQKIFAAFLMAFSKLCRGTFDLPPYWLRVFLWAGDSFPFFTNNWVEVHFSQLHVYHGANKLLSSGDSRDVLVVADVVAKNSTMYELSVIVRHLLTNMHKVTNWPYPYSPEVIERICRFKLAIGEDGESCDFVCKMVANGDSQYMELLLQRFKSVWTNAEPPGIPGGLQGVLSNNQQARSVLKSKLESFGEDGVRGLAYLNWIDSSNMSKVFSGCMGENSHLREACRNALVNWMSSIIVEGALPTYVSDFLSNMVLEEKGKPSPAWVVLTLMAELASLQKGSVSLFVRDKLSNNKKLEIIIGAKENKEFDVGDEFCRLLKSLVDKGRAKTSEEKETINAVGENLGQFLASGYSDLVKNRARQLQVFCTGLTGVRYNDKSLI